MIMIVFFYGFKTISTHTNVQRILRTLQADLHSIQTEQHSNVEVITVKWLEYFMQSCLYFTFKEYIFCILLSIFPTGALLCIMKWYYNFIAVLLWNSLTDARKCCVCPWSQNFLIRGSGCNGPKRDWWMDGRMELDAWRAMIKIDTRWQKIHSKRKNVALTTSRLIYIFLFISPLF